MNYVNVDLESKDLFDKVLFQTQGLYVGVFAIPNVGDTVGIHRKRWEVTKRSFYYQEDGTLNKIGFQCKENDS